MANIHAQRIKRQARTRFKLKKSQNGKPRLSVFLSNNYVYAQVIDDQASHTLASASTQEKSHEGATNGLEASAKIGKLIAERALDAGVTNVVFDKGRYAYHGKVKEIADAARNAGLKF